MIAQGLQPGGELKCCAENPVLWFLRLLPRCSGRCVIGKDEVGTAVDRLQRMG
jgi:hypothetical protein